MCPCLWPPYAKHNLTVRKEGEKMQLGQNRKKQEGGKRENILHVVRQSATVKNIGEVSVRLLLV